MHPNIVGLRILRTAHSLDVFTAKKKRLTNAMHAVHDAAIMRKDHGVVEVAVLNEPGMLYDIPAGQLGGSFVRPVSLIDFPDCG
jgi:hypothetical protein